MALIELRDLGFSYPGHDKKTIEGIDLDIEDRPIGGLGIFLIREMMDEMSYEYKNGCNILKLVVELNDL